MTSLPLGKVKREDAGDYEVVIKNELGEVSVTVQLIVLDKPSAPRQPDVSENTGERVVFHWIEPEFLGISPDVAPTEGITYVVEMREATQRVGKPVTTTKELSTPIDGLQLNKSYIFSVAAKNEVGQSDFVDSKPVSTKLEYGK
ncbi:fibronectin type III domain protein [Opisthorchis viverrini]|uniref:Fibronectin type III domain protein n=1 Tax=Opisthorchis viverrini TaxID=6198 RepID=A0A1S8WIB5_OPIVI|nr:fibronectin type III domain protein [Opisthorchis viverrini]